MLVTHDIITVIIMTISIIVVIITLTAFIVVDVTIYVIAIIINFQSASVRIRACVRASRSARV